MTAKSRAAVIGITGFIGSGLPALLEERGYLTTGVSRSGRGKVAGVDRWQALESADYAGHEVVINLAGAPVDRRWTGSHRRAIRESRVDLTRKLVSNLRRLPPEDRPKVLVNGSAVGIYGDRRDEIVREPSGSGQGFLADICRDWEAAALGAEDLGIRVVLLRTGIVLGRGGAAYQQLARVFKLGLGGKLGKGKQWMPWIHVDDQRAAIIHAAVSGTLRGPANLTAPTPERNEDFTRKFATALHRPAVFSVPGFALKLAFGEFAGELLGGQRALPKALIEDGFDFRYPAIEPALLDLVG